MRLGVIAPEQRAVELQVKPPGHGGAGDLPARDNGIAATVQGFAGDQPVPFGVVDRGVRGEEVPEVVVVNDDGFDLVHGREPVAVSRR